MDIAASERFLFEPNHVPQAVFVRARALTLVCVCTRAPLRASAFVRSCVCFQQRIHACCSSIVSWASERAPTTQIMGLKAYHLYCTW